MFKNWKANNAKRKDFSGEILTIPKSKDGYLRKLKLYGKSIQDGEPTPDNPVEVKTVPSELDITSCGRNLFDASKITNLTQHSVEENGRVIRKKTYASTSGYTFQFLPNTTYTISFKGTLSAGASGGAFGGIAALVPATTDIVFWLTEGQRINNITRTFTTPSQLPNNGRLILYLYAAANNGGNEYSYTWEDLVLTYAGIDDRSWKPYLGSTTPITLRDTDGNLHTLKSLPDGTRDEVDLDGGESVERCFLATIKDGTGWYINQEQTNTISIYKTRGSLGTTQGTLPLPMLSTWGAGIDYSIAQPSDQECVWFAQFSVGVKILKSRLSSPDLLGAQKYLKDKFETGECLKFLLPLANPAPWTLHPDEQKKIITVNSNTAYVYTNAEVQPEISANAISYGEE